MAEFWRHRKRGSVYEIISSTASLQCSTEPNIESALGDEDWTVYRNVKTGAVYIRLTNEFRDGRFEKSWARCNDRACNP